MRGAITPLPQYVFKAWYLVNHRDNFSFTFKTRSMPSCTNFLYDEPRIYRQTRARARGISRDLNILVSQSFPFNTRTYEYKTYHSRCSSVSNVTSLRVERMQFGSQQRQGRDLFYLRHRVRTGSGAHPVSYPMGNGSSFTAGKAVGTWSWPLTSFYRHGLRMREVIPPVPQYVFKAGGIVKHRDDFIFTNLNQWLPTFSDSKAGYTAVVLCVYTLLECLRHV
jgi:hypothetical protein